MITNEQEKGPVQLSGPFYFKEIFHPLLWYKIWEKIAHYKIQKHKAQHDPPKPAVPGKDLPVTSEYISKPFRIQQAKHGSQHDGSDIVAKRREDIPVKQSQHTPGISTARAVKTRQPAEKTSRKQIGQQPSKMMQKKKAKQTCRQDQQYPRLIESFFLVFT